MSEILSLQGYETRTAYDGRTALDICREFVPQIVITDVFLPGMNGIELGIAIRRDFPDCDILLLSGHGATFNMLEDARSQGNEFELLAKPVQPRDLLRTIDSVLLKRSA
jgi:YesN/AraC family two-component response regulator